MGRVARADQRQFVNATERWDLQSGFAAGFRKSVTMCGLTGSALTRPFVQGFGDVILIPKIDLHRPSTSRHDAFHGWPEKIGRAREGGRLSTIVVLDGHAQCLCTTLQVVSPRRPVILLPTVTHAREVFVGHIDLRQFNTAAIALRPESQDQD